MKILVYSDSHNNIKALNKIKNIINDFDKILFLGDGLSDFKDLINGFKGEAFAVTGNCDFSSQYPNERLVEFEGIKIFMCHGHRYNVKMNLNSIIYKGEECGADIILFGHSHYQFLQKLSNGYIMNPGSISHSYGMSSTGYGIIELNKNIITDIKLKELK